MEKAKGDIGKRNTRTSCRLPLAGGWLSGGAYALLCLFALVGCSSQRDMPTDPAVTPVVVPLDIYFDEQAGRVEIAWEYLGVERVDRYRLVRVGPGGIRIFDWITGPVSRSEDVRADVWPMPAVADALLNAGDLYSYIIETQNTRQIPAEAGMGDLLAPGTRMEQIAFQEDGTTSVSWHTPGKAPRRHDLFRQMGDAPFALMAQPAIDGDTSFVDHLPRGNVEYRYFMRNELDHGVVLDSRALVLRPFLHGQTFDAGALPGAHFLLAPSDGVHSSLLALFAAPDAVVVRQVGVDGVEDDPIGLPFPDYENMTVSSLSFSTLPFGFFADPHIFLAGIEPGAQRVRLQAFALRGSAAQPVAWDHAVLQVREFNFARRDYRSVEPRLHQGVRYVNASGVPDDLKDTQYTEWEARHRAAKSGVRRVNAMLAVLGAIWALNVVESAAFSPAPMGLTVSF